MRLLLAPGTNFWFQISIIGLFALPYVFYSFIHAFVEAKGYFLKNLFRGLTLVIILLNFFGVFLKAPKVITFSNSNPQFIYSMEWPIAIVAIFTVLVIIAILSIMTKEIKKNYLYDGRLNPIIVGMFVLFLGNMANLIPGVSSTSFDIIAGIVNGVIVFYALYKRRFFTLTLLANRSTTYIIATSIVALVFAYLINPIESLIETRFSPLYPFKTLIIAISFTMMVILVYVLFKKLFDHLFLKEEVVKAHLLKSFSLEISKTLNLEEIMPELVRVIEEGVGVEKVYVCMENESKTLFPAIYSSNPLDSKEFILSRKNPFVKFLEENKTCLIVKDFRKTSFYKSMWEQEKIQISILGAECLVPILEGNALIGMVLLTGKRNRGHFTYDDIDFLESINHIVSIAIKNAMLYKQAYMEARTDELTGLLNRKYFFKTIEEEFQKHRGDSLTLMILNLDDFKLYNQLYGNQEGDDALKNIAQILKGAIGKKGIVARYSGKEFAVILPSYDVLATSILAEEIRENVGGMNKGKDNDVLKVITFSAGICSYPYGSSNLKDLIENAEMTVFNVKRSGKNRIEVYSLKEPGDINQQRNRSINTDVYKEYASIIFALTAAVDTKDHYTFDHSQKVAEYATILASAIGLNDEHIEIIREAGLLHDIGKIGIPEHILNKTEYLTDEEFEIMKTHVENSISMIRHLPSLDYVIPGVLGHHERWDGKGYPRGTKGEDIPLSARCLAIADAFDAMTTKRSYKKPMPVDFAVGEIRKNAGKQFDPVLAKVFVELIENNRIII